MQFEGKLMTETQENREKSHFGPNIGPLGPNSGHQSLSQKPDYFRH